MVFIYRYCPSWPCHDKITYCQIPVQDVKRNNICKLLGYVGMNQRCFLCHVVCPAMVCYGNCLVRIFATYWFPAAYKQYFFGQHNLSSCYVITALMSSMFSKSPGLVSVWWNNCATDCFGVGIIMVAIINVYCCNSGFLHAIWRSLHWRLGATPSWLFTHSKITLQTWHCKTHPLSATRAHAQGTPTRRWKHRKDERDTNSGETNNGNHGCTATITCVSSWQQHMSNECQGVGADHPQPRPHGTHFATLDAERAMRHCKNIDK